MIIEAARGNCKSVNRNGDKTVTNFDLMTKDNVTRDSFQEHWREPCCLSIGTFGPTLLAITTLRIRLPFLFEHDSASTARAKFCAKCEG